MPIDHSKNHIQTNKQAAAESATKKAEVTEKMAAEKKARDVVSTAPDTIPLSALTAHVENVQSRLGELETALTPDLNSISPDAKAALRRLGIEINALRHISG